MFTRSILILPLLGFVAAPSAEAQQFALRLYDSAAEFPHDGVMLSGGEATMEFWCRQSNPTANSGVAIGRYRSSAEHKKLGIRADGSIEFLYAGRPWAHSGPCRETAAGLFPFDGEFHHVAFCRYADGSSKTYLDGTEVHSTGASGCCWLTCNVIQSTTTTYVAAFGPSNTSGWDLRGVRWSSVIRYQGNFTPEPAWTPDSFDQLHLPLEEGSGGSVADLGPALQIGQISGPYQWISTLVDCNGNGTADAEDIASGSSQDCNGNGIPDECDIAAGIALDCNGNGVPDSCDLAAGAERDCNGNGIPDSCDVAAGTSFDCDGNGVPDECDLASGANDCDRNGIFDACQIADNPSLDQNVNGILDSCECAIETFCLAAANSSGQPAAMGSSGTASLSANDLTLSVSNAPPFQFGLFFYGADEDFAIFGDGALCVSGPFARVLPVIATDGTGSASVLLNLYDDPFTVGPNIVAPFETWRFQFWYRDPLGGPSGFNLSNGLAVTFCP